MSAEEKGARRDDRRTEDHQDQRRRHLTGSPTQLNSAGGRVHKRKCRCNLEHPPRAETQPFINHFSTHKNLFTLDTLGCVQLAARSLTAGSTSD